MNQAKSNSKNGTDETSISKNLSHKTMIIYGKFHELPLKYENI